MIIYGTRATLLKTEFVPGQCYSCNSNNTTMVSVFQKYAHIFWIPFFPIGKVGVSQCSHCQLTMNSGKMPPLLQSSYENLKRDIKAPIWVFSGIALVVILAIIITITESEKAKRVSAMVQKPMLNDIFEIKQKDGSFTRIKINAVSKDSVSFYPNNYQSDRSTDLEKLEAKGYDTVSYIMPIKELIKMDQNDELIDIIRK